MNRVAAALAAGACLLAAACVAPPKKADTDQPVTDRARGVRYIVPAGWRFSDAEVRSPHGSLLTLRVYDLVEADKKFVVGLPDTLIPQLREWAELYYKVEGEPVRTQTTVAGVPATELVYPVRVRPKDPPTKVIYWVVKRNTRLFVLRAAFPATELAAEEPVLRKIVEGWTFL